MKTIFEKDWKYLSSIRETALNRLCARICAKLHRLSDLNSEENAHKQYLKIWSVMKKEDKTISHCFDDWRRSTAYDVLVYWLDAGLLTREEYDRLSDDTKAVCSVYLNSISRFHEEK